MPVSSVHGPMFRVLHSLVLTSYSIPSICTPCKVSMVKAYKLIAEIRSTIKWLIKFPLSLVA